MSARRIDVLALSYLFPNKAQPAYGIFVLNRLRAVRERCNLRVIAPVQWYPFIEFLRRDVRAGEIPLREELGGLEVYHPRFAVIPRHLKWLDALTYWWSAKSIVGELSRQGFGFDLVDAHWTYPDIVAACRLARAAGGKFIVTVRGHEALYREERSIRRWLVAHYLRKADLVVALSAELRDRVIELGVRPETVRVVLNGVDLDRFRTLDRGECRTHLGLALDKPIVISVGRLTEGKGHQDLIRAVAEVARGSDLQLYIIGGVNLEDHFERQLRNLIAELHLDNVHLVDKIGHDAMPFWYNAADVFCLASKREGCPNVVLEALACGTPVVVTDVGAVNKLIVPGTNGFLVPKQGSPTLATALDEALRRQWDRPGIAAAMSRWGWQRCAEEVYELYESVLQGQP